MTSEPAAGARDKRRGRPWVQVRFLCCNAYRRIYLTADETAFAGHCPKCCREVRIPVGPGGSASRTWVAG